MVEHGRLVSLLFVCSATPRRDQRRVLFIREVAARIRTATARKQAETALRASEAELRLSPTHCLLVAFIDRSLTYRFANAAYQAWFGRPRRPCWGERSLDLVGEDGLALRRSRNRAGP